MKDLGTLHVNMFHNCSVTRRAGDAVWLISDQDSASKKVWQLLTYLLWNHDKPVPRTALIDLLWGDEDIADPSNSLKVLFFRVRNLLGKEGLGFEDVKNILIFRGGNYLWNPALTFSLDTARFEQYCTEAETDDPDDALQYLLDAIALYTGDFLSQGGESEWAIPLSVYFHAKFLKACAAAIEIMYQAGLHDEVIQLCRRAVVVEPYDELLHTAMIRSLAESGAINVALQHYQYTTDLFMRQFGVSPSQEMEALYQSLRSSSTEENLQNIRSELTESNFGPGPYFCTYTAFKEIYHLSARSAARSGEAMQLVMLTVNLQNEPAHKKLTDTMQALHSVIGQTLRLGDVITQYSQTQFLLLLPSASYENAEKVAVRLLNRFAQQYKNTHRIHYSLLPILPALHTELFLGSPRAEIAGR